MWGAARGFLPLGLHSGSGCLPHTPSYCGAGARGEWLQEEIKKSFGWCNAKQVTALPKTPCTSPAILSEKCWYQNCDLLQFCDGTYGITGHILVYVQILLWVTHLLTATLVVFSITSVSEKTGATHI